MNGARLRALRERAKMTQEELAQALDVAFQQVHRWESGKNDPSADKIAQMARLFNVTSDYLLGLSDRTTISLDDLTDEEREVVELLRLQKRRKPQSPTDEAALKPA